MNQAIGLLFEYASRFQAVRLSRLTTLSPLLDLTGFMHLVVAGHMCTSRNLSSLA